MNVAHSRSQKYAIQLQHDTNRSKQAGRQVCARALALEIRRVAALRWLVPVAAVRFGPIAASMRTKFGRESPPSSSPKKSWHVLQYTMHLVHDSAFWLIVAY